MFSKSGAEYTERLPLMAKAFQRLPARAAVLDGELCFIDAGGQANFRKLHTEMRTRWPDEAQLIFMVYDLLHQDGVDLRPLPLSERKRDLDRLCRKARMPFMRLVETFPDGQVLYEHCSKFGFEGVVSKRIDQPYVSGLSKYWSRSNARNGSATTPSVSACSRARRADRPFHFETPGRPVVWRWTDPTPCQATYGQRTRGPHPALPARDR